ncbi:ABC transporter permease [Haloglycomyces albus]|uniref:ABC transporter permease n=1 Tax=Haloglycomyces albus TaxID=526067 RepID=UPI000686C927|nr:ABC transporter permease [Haloglycomyces albus]
MVRLPQSFVQRGESRSRRVNDGVPLGLLFPAMLGALFLVLPLLGILTRTPWSELPSRLADPAIRSALWLSVQTATIATLVCLVLGIPLAWLLARSRLRGLGVLRAFITVPLVLPPVVGGIALLLVFGRDSFIGRRLEDWFDVVIPFSTTGVVLAMVFVAMPFLVVSVEGALRSADDRYEDAAATLGASRWSTFLHVTLPNIVPGVVSGAVLCWARALGEFGATITFAGNFPGRTQTMPLAVYLALESDLEGALVLSLILLVVSVVILFALRTKWVGGHGR